MTTTLLFIHAISPLHAGTGQSVGAIDLAIARERATGIPYLPGSSLKGALRDRFEHAHPQDVRALFGPPTAEASEGAGSVFFGDARLVLLPVRSLAGTFGLVTSPYLLSRLSRDLVEAGAKPLPAVSPLEGRCAVTSTSALELTDGRVVFEDLDFAADATAANDVADRLKTLLTDIDVAKRLCVVADDVMSFLLEQNLEVNARIRLDDDTKTVANGALWYEEALPAESVLVSMILAQPTKASTLTPAAVIAKLTPGLTHLLQLGGKATVGRGLCRLWLGGGA